MKLLRFAAGAIVLAIVALFLLPLLPAFAQTVAEKTVVDTTIEIPVGDWITAVGAVVLTAIPATFAWFCRMLPSYIGGLLMQVRADKMLELAIQYGINATANATKDKPLSVDVGSEVLENALQYVIDNAPKFAKWIGGSDLIRQKIIARLNLEPDVYVDPRAPGVLNSAS